MGRDALPYESLPVGVIASKLRFALKDESLRHFVSIAALHFRMVVSAGSLGRDDATLCIAVAIVELHVKTKTSMVHVRMDAETKQKALEVLAPLGLTASEAVRILFHRIVVDQAFPLELKVPNTETRRAMAEVEDMVRLRKARFAGADELFADLEIEAASSQ